MPDQATYDDANLILRLYEIRREEKMRIARDWFARNFRPKTMEELEALTPLGSQESAYARQTSSYFEMVASFVTSGILNKELYFQSGGELALTYIRMKPVLKGMRKMYANPDLFRNLEKVGEDYLAFFAAKSPEALDALVARMS